ncbi:MAG TPA: hypothetical protein VJO34_01395 [Methylomirabilota bacterium]|nr:hypothetical protein [Methylomirabilota bacterium]
MALSALLTEFLNSEAGKAALIALLSYVMSKPAFAIGNFLKKYGHPSFAPQIPTILTSLGLAVAALGAPAVQSLLPGVDLSDLLLSSLVGTQIAKARHDDARIASSKVK